MIPVLRKEYFQVSLLLLVISIVYFMGIAPDMTWMGLAGDSPNYVSSSILFQKAFLAGYPFYIIIGWLFERLPFNDSWNLGLLSAISTIVTSYFIYLTIRMFTGKGVYPFIGLIAYPAAFLVWTQSVIPEVYTFSTMLMVMGTYFTFKGVRENQKYLYIAAAVFGLSLGTHPLVVFTIIPCIIYVRRSMKDKIITLRLILIGMIGLLSYLQVILDKSNSSFVEVGIGEKIKLTLISLDYVGGLSAIPLGPTIDRLQDVGFVLLISIGILIPFFFYIKKSWSLYKKEFIVLLVAGIGPGLVYLTGFPPQWVTYMIPFIAFISIFAGIVAKEFPYKEAGYIAVVGGLLLLGTNIIRYDIGRSIDPEPTTMRQAYEMLDNLQNDVIIYTHTWGHMSVLVDSYNKLNDARLIPVDIALRTYNREDTTSGLIFPVLEEDIVSFGDEEEDVRLLQALNPSKQIVVAFISESKKVGFDLISASLYTNRLNDVYRRDQSSIR